MGVGRGGCLKLFTPGVELCLWFPLECGKVEQTVYYFIQFLNAPLTHVSGIRTDVHIGPGHGFHKN